MKCSTCDNTDKDISFFIAIEDDKHVCGDCVKKMYTHLLKHYDVEPSESTEILSQCSKNAEGIPSTKSLVDYLDQYIIGQEVAKKDIAIAVRNHYKRLSLPEKSREDVEKSNILLMGESGTGKTKIIQQIAKLIDVPMVVVDCTAMSAVGYTGDDIESSIKDLYTAAKGNKERTEMGIVFLDEIDKKKRSRDSKVADVGGEDVQKAMLRMLEGKKVKVTKTVEIDTSNILFIAGGAFVGLDKIVENRLQTKSIGFGRDTTTTNIMDGIYEKVTTDDLVAFGLIPELIGRLPIHTYTKSLSKEDIKKIMTDTKNSAVKQFQTLFKVDGVNLNFRPSAIEYVANKVMKDKIGVRGIRKVLELELRDIQFELETLKDKNVKSITVEFDDKKNRLKTSLRYERKKTLNSNK